MQLDMDDTSILSPSTRLVNIGANYKNKTNSCDLEPRSTSVCFRLMPPCKLSKHTRNEN